MGPITELPELDEASMNDHNVSTRGSRPARGGGGGGFGGNRNSGGRSSKKFFIYFSYKFIFLFFFYFIDACFNCKYS